MIAALMAWSLMIAPPTAPLTEAQKKAEYDMVKVDEALTPEQIKKRDIIPGWRPITACRGALRALERTLAGGAR